MPMQSTLKYWRFDTATMIGILPLAWAGLDINRGLTTSKDPTGKTILHVAICL